MTQTHYVDSIHLNWTPFVLPPWNLRGQRKPTQIRSLCCLRAVSWIIIVPSFVSKPRSLVSSTNTHKTVAGWIFRPFSSWQGLSELLALRYLWIINTRKYKVPQGESLRKNMADSIIHMVHNLYLSHGTSHFLLWFIDVQVLSHPTKLQAP